mmetsp:Transcript_30951/g.34520  ORF Transcript_30951/g.34520 Transcript_30951/m.34520 type:complete len:390 (-) Transcript_30951:184-1353(-)
MQNISADSLAQKGKELSQTETTVTKPDGSQHTEKRGKQTEKGSETTTYVRKVKKKEWEDEPDVLSKKLKKLEALAHSASNIVFYTGAGVSTSAGVPDFRGDKGLRKRGLLGLREEDLDTTMPTISHVIIQHFLDKGIAKAIVTSNHDNMHRKAGAPDNKLAELFGNAYIEKCLKCKKMFQRKVIVPHLGRTCEECSGRLVKTGVRYGQATPEEPLELACKFTKKADLAIVLGSSMRTGPFCNLPPKAKKMVIVNLQPTPYDSKATIKINAPCDKVMTYLANTFKINPTEFTYEQEFQLEYKKSDDNVDYTVKSTRTNEPVTCIDDVTIDGSYMQETQKNDLVLTKPMKDSINIVFNFKEDYNVDPLKMTLSLDKKSDVLKLKMTKTIQL